MSDLKKLFDDLTNFEQIENLPFESWPEEWKRIYWKTYPRLPKVSLPKTALPPKDLGNVLMERETRRSFDETLNLEDLSAILGYSLGLSGKVDSFPKRTYPSAGARYPIEGYILSTKIKDLEKGAYHYNVKEGVLELLLRKDFSPDMQKIILNQDDQMYQQMSGLLILTSVISRCEIKYGKLAYNFSLIECGHIGQNVSLVSEALNAGSCAIGGINTKEISRILDLTEEELPLYAFVLGKLGSKSNHV